MAKLHVTGTIAIDEGELDERFVLASGPGGQNVNKVATAVQLRFDLARSGLDERLKRRVAVLAGRRLGKDGVLTILARRFRTQEQNRQDARERLFEIIRLAAEPETPRIATRPSRAVRRRRLDDKRSRSAVKRARSRPTAD